MFYEFVTLEKSWRQENTKFDHNLTGSGISRGQSGGAHAAADSEHGDADAFAYGWRSGATAGTVRNSRHATDGHARRTASIGFALLS